MWLPLGCKVTDAHIRQAQELRAYRDSILQNRWPKRDPDMRWHGDLGEIVLDHWLSWRGIEHTWFYDPADGNPDFLIGPYAVEAKTRYSYYRPQPDWQLRVFRHHLEPPKAPYYAFSFYQPSTKVMWFIGVCTPQCFIENAIVKKVGEPLGGKSADIVLGGDQYEATNLAFLTPMQQWLRETELWAA